MTSATVIGANMAADQNMNFHMGTLPSSLHNSHVVSFQSGAISSSSCSSMMFPMDSSGGVSSTAGVTLAGSPGGMNNTFTMNHVRTSSGSLFMDQMPGVKADGLAADWSYDEQLSLEAGLLKYANEPNMMKYIRIAASLHDKTVRDVALRCRWMTKENGKRRKSEEYYIGKKVKDRKEKMVDASLIRNLSPCQPANVAATYSFTVPHMGHNNLFSCEVPVIDGATQCRIEENSMLFCQVEDNFAALKLQDNINLLCQSRNNITSILTSLRKMPGIMSQMPPLPIDINKELADAILPYTNQQQMFGVPGGNS